MLFSDEEKYFLAQMFASHSGLEQRFQTYLEIPASERFQKAMDDLEKVPRTGWVKRQVKNPESVMDHIEELTEMAMQFELPSDLQCMSKGDARTRLRRMAAVHDIPEAIVTDFTPSCPISSADKERLERLAAKVIFESYPLGQTLVCEYIEQLTPLSHTLHDLDRLAPVFKALEYEGIYPEKRGKLFHDFLSHAKPRLKTDAGRTFCENIERDAESIRKTARQQYLEEKFAGREA